MKFGFFTREAVRALRRNAVPSFAAVATVLVTVLVLGVFIPVVQATTGAANEIRAKVIVATHDSHMVDRMRRRVIELDQGRLVRDEHQGAYARSDMSTAEFGALLREPAPEPKRLQEPGDDIDSLWSA